MLLVVLARVMTACGMVATLADALIPGRAGEVFRRAFAWFCGVLLFACFVCGLFASQAGRLSPP